MTIVRAKLGLLGASGRMGRIVQRVVADDYGAEARVVHTFSRENLGIAPELDAIVDFSLPDAVLSCFKAYESKAQPPALAIASTGWDDAGRSEIERYAKRAPVMVASNYSLGVHALEIILRTAAPLLTALGYTPVLIEAHHRHKRDAPSGTAISIQSILDPSTPDSVQTHSIRAGEVIGDHTVHYYGSADRLTIEHSAGDRSIFARGAVEAAIWLAEEQRKGRTGIVALEEFISTKIARERGTSK